MAGKTIPTPELLTNLFSDIGNEPDWRGRAAKEKAWEDSHQWTKAQLAHFKKLGMPEEMMVNLMAPAMDAVTGYEAKHRVDWMLNSSDESQELMVEGINHEFNDEMRLADANSACSDAYSSQAGVGVGWVHVADNPNILEPSKLLIENVHRDEMFWDMRSRSGTLKTDCRWIARRKFFDKDEAQALFPCHKELIDFTWSDWRTIDINPSAVQSDWFTELDKYTGVIEEVMEGISERKRIAIYETYYKVVERRPLLISPDGLIVEFIESNPIHIEMLVSGMAQLHTDVPINIVKEAWFIGANCIFDGKSRSPHNQFPYVPFFGVREDGTNTPQGLLRRMMSPQEEYNRAAVEIQHILRSRRIEKDEDATMGMTDDQVVHESSRADGVINLKRGSRFQVMREWEQLAALEGICKRAKEEINMASGIYQTFQGQTEGKQSGIAVESIAELGAQTLGRLNAHYQLSRKMVGELAFAHIVENIGTSTKTIKVPKSIGQQQRDVHLNDGVDNRLSTLRASVALQEVHTSAGYKQHTHQRLTSIMAELPDEMKSSLLPLWIESSDLPKKEFAMKAINKQLGYIEDEDKQAEAEAQQAQQAEEARQLEIARETAEIQKLNAEAAEKQANIAENEAQAENYRADAGKKRAETVKLLREIKLLRTTGGNATDPRKATPSVAPERTVNG